MYKNVNDFIFVKCEDEEQYDIDSSPEEYLTALDEKITIPSLYCKPSASLLEHEQWPGDTSQSTGHLPYTESWPGEHNMKVEIEDAGNWKKRGYVYSPLLNKLYIQMDKYVAVNVLLTGPTPANCVVRAVPLYVDIGSRSQPVLRCPVHSNIEDPSNRLAPREIVKHIVRSSDVSAKYFENQTSGRLSLTTAVKDKAPGSDYFTVFYQFMCLGSCVGGLARRPVQIIFTLEKEMGEVLGRQVMEVRICSCPIRDMKLEEQKMSSPLQVKNKRSLISTIEPDSQDTSYGAGEEIFWVPVRGIKNYQEVNNFAEYLDIKNESKVLTERALKLKEQRNQLIAIWNK